MRAEIAVVYEQTFGQTCRRDTLDALESIERWLRACESHEGRTFLRSVREAAAAIDGWRTTGRRGVDKKRFRNSLTRRLDMLRAMGRIERWDAVYGAAGQGLGILVTLRRDSSVGRAHLKSVRGRLSAPRRP